MSVTRKQWVAACSAKSSFFHTLAPYSLGREVLRQAQTLGDRLLQGQRLTLGPGSLPVGLVQERTGSGEVPVAVGGVSRLQKVVFHREDGLSGAHESGGAPTITLKCRGAAESVETGGVLIRPMRPRHLLDDSQRMSQGPGPLSDANLPESDLSQVVPGPECS